MRKSTWTGQNQNNITVIVPTYKRPKILVNTIAALDKHLKYDGQIHIVIGVDDEEGEESRTAFYIEEVLSKSPRMSKRVTTIINDNRGLGANLNSMMKLINQESWGPLVFQFDDDHVLQEDLDLTPHARALLNDEGMEHGWIRLMFGHSSERSVWPRDYYRFKAQLYKYYWRVLPGEGELWVPSNRPHLKHIGFHEYYGYYKEDAKLGETERDFCSRWNLRGNDGPGVFVPFWPPHEDTWAHVGDSWQKKGF